MRLHISLAALALSLAAIGAGAAPALPENDVVADAKPSVLQGQNAAGAQDGSAPAGDAQPTQSIATPTLEALQKRLQDAYREAWPEGGPHLSGYLEAQARLEETRSLLSEKPKHKEADRLREAAGMLAEMAMTEIQAAKMRMDLEQVRDARDSAQTNLVMVLREINQIERGYASSLKRDLDEERRKALERQQEARSRLDALQSDLIQVKRDARGIILSMSDILFDIGKASLTQQLKTNLAKIAGILTVYKEANVIVEGHTDNQGTEDYNQKLSERRAENVMEYLVEQGIPQGRLTSVGYGFSKPVAGNETAEGRQKNRRVDLVIQDKQLQ